MSKSSDNFKGKYGPWALVAGASVGLGAAFASELAQKGLNVVLVARRPGPLEDQASGLKARYGIAVRTVSVDLAAPDMLEKIAAATSDLEVGLLVYDTAYLPIGPFFSHPLEKHLRVIDVNCRGPLVLTYHFGRKMIERKRGGIILMTSLSGMQGAPWIASYGASKAFNIVLGEGVSYELKNKGIDMLACCAGAIATPNYVSSEPKALGGFAPKPLSVEQVAREAVAGLGKTSLVIPGSAYRFSQTLLERFMSRKQRIKIMANSTEKMYGERVMTLN